MKYLNMEQKTEIARLEGVLLGLKICKEMWAQGAMSHENIVENEIFYKEQLELEKQKPNYKTIIYPRSK